MLSPPGNDVSPLRPYCPSTSTHQPEHSTHQDYSLAERPMNYVQPPFHPSLYLPAPATDIPHTPYLAQHPFPPGPYPLPQQLQRTHYQNHGMFSGSHNLSISDNTFIDNSSNSDNCKKQFALYISISLLTVIFVSHERLSAAYNNWGRVRLFRPQSAPTMSPWNPARNCRKMQVLRCRMRRRGENALGCWPCRSRKVRNHADGR
jgi:hypothetical protein